MYGGMTRKKKMYGGAMKKRKGMNAGGIASAMEVQKPLNMQVEAPKGYHWMKSGKGYKLMKDPKGGYKPHKGASKKASFQIQKVHKK